MKLYVIYDTVAQEGGPIYEAKNDAVAVRMVRQYLDQMNDGDYKLYCVGSYCHDPIEVCVDDPIREVKVVGNSFVEDGKERIPSYMNEKDAGSIVKEKRYA